MYLSLLDVNSIVWGWILGKNYIFFTFLINLLKYNIIPNIFIVAVFEHIFSLPYFDFHVDLALVTVNVPYVRAVDIARILAE